MENKKTERYFFFSVFKHIIVVDSSVKKENANTIFEAVLTDTSTTVSDRHIKRLHQKI